ncbi:hypothetical protein Rsub_08022 [Raphidocelis subcapitata]|uniref:DUF1995 domain-containing protein n=1 Tax=Raphidocelis subcapitata TaxID=307507 RepID=A0A2V0PAF9_9CHLO|nr:hypothetical protein Rsub_08022 [Raphidocelis subcapitata]|eukprot:GBF94850.1 hypothetical protein Rsub_08022 [Raphidocelis subcapitata]
MQSLNARRAASAAGPAAAVAARARRAVRARAGGVATSTAVPLPVSGAEQAAQAAEAVKAAAAQGARLHSVVVINPVNEKAIRFSSTEAMDYPCSNMKEFETLVGVTKDILRGVLGGAPELRVRRIDEGGLDGDLCAIVSDGEKRVMAVVWPTAEKLPTLKKLAQDSSIGQLIIVNPLWRTEGNLVSEFGILPWDRKANEEFVASFFPAYALFEQRIGAPSSVNLARGTRYETGAVLRILKVGNGQFCAHVMSADGTSQAIGGFDTKPAYRELEQLIAKAREAKLEIFEVARAASSLDLEAARGRSPSLGSDDDDAVPDVPEAAAASFPTREQLLAMESDPKAVRRILLGLGLPGSGSAGKIMARAYAVADALAAGASFADALAAAQKLR